MTLRYAHALLSTTLAAAACLAADVAWAHGTMITPASRVYACFQGNPENPTNPACAAARAVAGSQAFYDWNGINQANANGNHQAVVPDGKLCSGNNPTFRGLDLDRSDWTSTPIQADAAGKFTFVFKATAPHATRDWRFFVTRQGWQPGSPLRWADLQEFCTLGNTPLSADGTYRLQCTLPQRSGPHVIYNTWQRSDSTEAFYTCMDVRFEGGSSGGGTTPAQWQDAGPLTARGELPVGTTLALRVFNAGGNDIERVQATVVAGQTAPTQWPLLLARQVNASAQQARVGVLRDGSITALASATENRVYLRPGQRFQLDTRVPDSGTLPGAGTGDFDHVYPAGIGSYRPGETVVKGSDGKLYACRPAPQGGWCNVGGPAYSPGVGAAWRDAWIPY